MYIIRDIERDFDRIRRLYKVVLITGPRQTGKTALARHLLPDHRWVLLDSAAQIEAARKDPALFLANHPPPVIFDEVQRAPELFPEIKALVDASGPSLPQGGIILTGSQPLPLMKSVTESMAGRVGLVQLPPMSLAEVLEVAGRPRLLTDWLDHPPIGDTFPFATSPAEYLVRGGFPAMALAQHSPSVQDSAQRLGDYIQTYLTRDLRELAQVHDLGKFERLLRQLSIHSSRLLNVSEAGSVVGIKQSTADEWIGILEASQLLWRVPGYARQHTRRERKGAKMFMCDSGLMASLLGYQSSAQVLSSPLLGPLFETAAAASMRKIARSFGGAFPLFHWRLDDKEEVDLLVEIAHNDVLLVEFKFTGNPTVGDCAGIYAYRRRYKSQCRAAVVSANPTCFWLTPDILHLPWSGL